MNNKKNTTLFVLGFVALLSLLTAVVCADSDPPLGVRSISVGSPSRLNSSAYLPGEVNVTAGEITDINLSAISATKAWAGYYGEVTGTLTLEDASGFVFYNWSTMEPKGEVYASIAGAITWASIDCFAYDGSNGFDVDTAEGWYGIQDDDEDGINETFRNLSTQFQIGSVIVTGCPATYPFRNGLAWEHSDFENILLTDTAALIFTAIIENNEADTSTDVEGYNGVTHDFQLLLAENGQDGQEDTATLYYFWAEIE